MPIHVTCFVCGTAFQRKASRIARAHGRPTCSNACKYAKQPPAPLDINEDGTTVRIPLHARDGSVRAYALIDADDAERILRRRWTLSAYGYAVRSATLAPKQHAISWMHREVLGIPFGEKIEVDHLNRNKLDNRKANLRRATRSINAQNHPGEAHGTSRYRGVSWDSQTKRWRVQVKVNDRMVYSARFDDEEAAARAARDARLRLMPGAVD